MRRCGRAHVYLGCAGRALVRTRRVETGCCSRPGAECCVSSLPAGQSADDDGGADEDDDGGATNSLQRMH